MPVSAWKAAREWSPESGDDPPVSRRLSAEEVADPTDADWVDVHLPGWAHEQWLIYAHHLRYDHNLLLPEVRRRVQQTRPLSEGRLLLLLSEYERTLGA